MFYGGAAGGGKTKALLMDDLADCVRYPGIEVWEFRRSYPELQASFVRELANVGYARSLGARWAESRHELRFDNGSALYMRYAENISDATRYLSGQAQKLTIDERTTMVPEVVARLASRIRSGSATIPVIGIRSASNPGGIGHADCRERYIVATNYGASVITDNRNRTRRFIPAKIVDNPHLNPEYITDLDDLPADLREAYKEGSWDTFAGQVFSEWSHDRHVVRAFTPPPTWKRLAGIDWGYAAPHAVLHVAYNDGRAWVYRERYGTQTGERDLARLILEDEGAFTADGRIALNKSETVRLRLADPSMWNKVAEANPIADTFIAAGCAVVKATNDRIDGVQRVHTYLADGPACHIHRKAGWETCPLLHVMDNCSNLIRTLPSLPHDDTKVEDVDTDAEDHCLAAGTLIDTIDGPIPVEQLVGTHGWAWGINGLPVPFFDVRRTREQTPVVRVMLADGRGVTCTPDHQFPTPNGWTQAADLLPGTMIQSCSLPRSKSGTPSGSTSAASTSGVTVSSSTGLCGQRHTGQSRQTTTSTTATESARTTDCATLSRFRRASTSRTTHPTRRPLSGRHAAATSSTPATATLASPRPSVPTQPRVDGTTSSACRCGASSAMHASRRHSLLEPASAAAPVRPVPVVGVSPAGLADVYDLSVEDPTHALTVNGGVGVSNCYDALRYVLMQLPLPHFKREKRSEPKTLAEMVEAGFDRRTRARQYHSELGAF